MTDSRWWYMDTNCGGGLLLGCGWDGNGSLKTTLRLWNETARQNGFSFRSEEEKKTKLTARQTCNKTNPTPFIRQWQ
uniref:Uncharacterized protein n=1 Tax=Anguilla anguilla TaxID=7936 RepID=A0A0E9UJ33_ANGAN